jgi:hypothetical protein
LGGWVIGGKSSAAWWNPGGSPLSASHNCVAPLLVSPSLEVEEKNDDIPR